MRQTSLGIAAAGFGYWLGSRHRSVRAATESVWPANPELSATRVGSPDTALSLTAFQNDLEKRGQSWQSSREGLPNLQGLTGIEGFITSDDGDVVLVGRREPDRPPIETDAFVIAVRNAFQASEAYHGVLGCSIDPRPGDDPWTLQNVRVFGMPSWCVMAARHVQLDYEMKKVAAGIKTSREEAFRGVFELARDESPVCEGNGDVQNSAVHRFWFYPRTPPCPRFSRCGKDVRILSRVGVQLLTEQELLNQQGKRVGTTKPNPESVRFAEQMTGVLASDHVNRYKKLVNDFRVIEVAKLMRFVGIETDRLDYILHGYPLAQVEVPKVVGGIFREEAGQAVCATSVSTVPDGIEYRQQTERYRYRYRGGVEARIELAPSDFVTTPPCESPLMRDRVPLVGFHRGNGPAGRVRGRAT